MLSESENRKKLISRLFIGLVISAALLIPVVSAKQPNIISFSPTFTQVGTKNFKLNIKGTGFSDTIQVALVRSGIFIIVSENKIPKSVNIIPAKALKGTLNPDSNIAAIFDIPNDTPRNKVWDLYVITKNGYAKKCCFIIS